MLHSLVFGVDATSTDSAASTEAADIAKHNICDLDAVVPQANGLIRCDTHFLATRAVLVQQDASGQPARMPAIQLSPARPGKALVEPGQSGCSAVTARQSRFSGTVHGLSCLR